MSKLNRCRTLFDFVKLSGEFYVTAIPAMALAAALTYVLVDFVEPHLNTALYWVASIVLFLVIYKVSNHILKSLKD